MLWAQRVSSSVHSICTPTAVCGRLSAARAPAQRFLSCPAFYQGACTPGVQTSPFCGYRVVGRHRFGQLNMLRRGSSEQNADTSSQDFSETDCEDPAQAPYRVVNFYHLIDIQNPYQVSFLLAESIGISGFWHLNTPSCYVIDCLSFMNT